MPSHQNSRIAFRDPVRGLVFNKYRYHLLTKLVVLIIKVGLQKQFNISFDSFLVMPYIRGREFVKLKVAGDT